MFCALTNLCVGVFSHRCVRSPPLSRAPSPSLEVTPPSSSERPDVTDESRVDPASPERRGVSAIVDRDVVAPSPDSCPDQSTSVSSTAVLAIPVNLSPKHRQSAVERLEELSRLRELKKMEASPPRTSPPAVDLPLEVVMPVLRSVRFNLDVKQGPRVGDANDLSDHVESGVCAYEEPPQNGVDERTPSPPTEVDLKRLQRLRVKKALLSARTPETVTGKVEYLRSLRVRLKERLGRQYPGGEVASNGHSSMPPMNTPNQQEDDERRRRPESGSLSGRNDGLVIFQVQNLRPQQSNVWKEHPQRPLVVEGQLPEEVIAAADCGRVRRGRSAMPAVESTRHLQSNLNALLSPTCRWHSPHSTIPDTGEGDLPEEVFRL